MPEIIAPEPEIIPPLKPLLTVSACPHPFEQRRIDYIVPAGATIAEIIELIQPDPLLREHGHVYVGDHMIPRERWRLVRPKHGHLISIRLLPSGGGGWRIAAMIGIAVLAIAAMVFAPYLAPVLVTGATTTGALGVALGAGAAMIVSVGGTLLLNTFLPPPVPEVSKNQGTDPQVYIVQGARNRADIWGKVPFVCGWARVVPPYAALPYREVIGTDAYWRAIFALGHGPLAIGQQRIGETNIENYQEVEVEYRRGYWSLTDKGSWSSASFPTNPQFGDTWTMAATRTIDGATYGAGQTITFNGLVAATSKYAWDVDQGKAFALYPDDVNEDVLAVELKYNVQQVRSTQNNANEVSIEIVFESLTHIENFPAGKRKDLSVVLKVEQRAYGGSVWSTVLQPTITGRQQTPLYWGHRWKAASYGAGDANGRYDVRVTRLTPDFDQERNFGKSNWNILRTITTGSPVPVSGVAMIAVRVKGTGQLQGTLDEYNVDVQTIARDWDNVGQTWRWAQTSSPAALVRHMLQHPSRRRPAADTQIDLAKLAYWDTVTRPAGRNFNGVFDSKTSLYDALMRVARLGRAVMTLRDLKYSVVIDEPKTVPVRMFSPRNSWGYEGELTTETPPHGYRIGYVNAAENSKADELVVYDDGYNAGNATLIDKVEILGINNHAQAFKEGRFHIAQQRLRREIHRINTDFEHLACERGDLVALQHDVIAVGLANGRIIARTEAGGHNFLLHSADFSNAAWVKANASITANNTTDPYGGSAADKIAESTTTSTHSHSVSQAKTLQDGLAYTFSVYAKAAQRSAIRLSFSSSALWASGQIPYAQFNLSTGVVAQTIGAGVSAGISDAGNGWYRCWVTAKPIAAGAGNPTVYLLTSPTGAVIYAGTVGSGAYLWGAQLEPTASSTAINLATGNPAWDQWDAYVIQKAQEYGHPSPRILKSQMWWESEESFDVYAMSWDAPCGIPAGWTDLESRSFGLFQVTPACGEFGVAQLPNGHPNVTTNPSDPLWATSIYNPLVNIDLGVKHIAEGYWYFREQFPACTAADTVLMAAAGYVQDWETVVGCNQYSDPRQDDYVFNVLRFHQQYYGSYPTIEQAVLPSAYDETTGATNPMSVTDVTLDNAVTMEAGKLYGFRARRIYGSAMRTDLYRVNTIAGESPRLWFSAPPLLNDAPDVGDLVSFGIYDRETLRVLVRDIEPQQDLTAKLTLIAEAAGVHTAEFAPIPPYDPVVTAPLGLPAPVVLDIQSDERAMIVTPSRELIDRVIFHLQPIDIGGASLFVLYRLSATHGGWQAAAIQEETASSVAIIGIESGETYDFQLAYTHPNYLSSPATQINGHYVAGRTTVPAALQNLSLAIVGGQALLMWSLPPEIDVQYGGWIMFRHSPDMAATVWPNSTSLAQAVVGDQTHVYMPLKPGTYFARTYDADGRGSTTFAYVSTAQASLLNFSPVGLITEDPLFTGGKANCTVTSGYLTLTEDTFDAYPDVTVLAWWGITGGSADAGQYNYAVGMDLGSVKKCRITSHVKVEAINVNDYWDSKIGNIDTWQDIDGTVGAVVDAQCWGKYDTVAYNTYANWFEAPLPLKRIEALEAEVRSIGALHLRLTCADPSFNLKVTELRLKADERV